MAQRISLNTKEMASHQAIVAGFLKDLADQMGVTAARPWTITDRVIDMPDPTKDNNLAALTKANAALRVARDAMAKSNADLQAAHDALAAEHAKLQAQLAKIAAIQKDLG
jgi:hypothetical protein